VKQRIAFFDFDGTITTKDTLLEFIKFYKGSFSFYAGFLLYSPLLIAFKLKLIPNFTAKQQILRHFFGGESVTFFQEQCNNFVATKLPGLIRPKALVEIEKLKAAGFTIVVVSASAENWIRQWTAANGLGLMGTRLAVQGDKITGSLDGKNCYGDEKACRIREQFNLDDYREIYSYGDSGGDKAMLALAGKRFYKPFR
jgi:HAD superfamily hydrolase (TIGR01490 family)